MKKNISLKKSLLAVFLLVTVVSFAQDGAFINPQRANPNTTTTYSLDPSRWSGGVTQNEIIWILNRGSSNAGLLPDANLSWDNGRVARRSRSVTQVVRWNGCENIDVNTDYTLNAFVIPNNRVQAFLDFLGSGSIRTDLTAGQWTLHSSRIRPINCVTPPTPIQVCNQAQSDIDAIINAYNSTPRDSSFLSQITSIPTGSITDPDLISVLCGNINNIINSNSNCSLTDRGFCTPVDPCIALKTWVNSILNDPTKTIVTKAQDLVTRQVDIDNCASINLTFTPNQ